MFKFNLPLVLASSSPRRIAFLRDLDIAFTHISPEIDESRLPDEHPQEMVTRLSLEKGRAVAALTSDSIVISADTCVTIDNLILGKPSNHCEHYEMLEILSNKTHKVWSACVVTLPNGTQDFKATATDVSFSRLTHEKIEWYISTGEGFDKAGGYAIQGKGAALVERIDGSVTNVVGMNMTALLDMLESHMGKE